MGFCERGRHGDEATPDADYSPFKSSGLSDHQKVPVCRNRGTVSAPDQIRRSQNQGLSDRIAGLSVGEKCLRMEGKERDAVQARKRRKDYQAKVISRRRVRILAACEFSGTVRDAFRRLGHDAWSCDFLPSERPGPHIQGDVLGILGDSWDLMIACPPCTYLSASGIHWTRRGLRDPKLTETALEFVQKLLDAPIPRICLENPVGIISTRIRRPDQMIQPWWFGDDASKRTCLWLKNLPGLVPTNMLPGDNKTRRANQTPTGQNKLGPSKDRWLERSRTYPGVAEAMALQWSAV